MEGYLGKARKLFSGQYVLYGTIGFILLLSFTVNIFGTGQDTKWFDNFEKFSSSIPEKTAECNGMIDGYSGPLLFYGESKYSTGCSSESGKPYVSQYGLQSRIFAFLHPGGEDTLRLFNIGSILLSTSLVGLLLFLLRVVHVKFGKLTMISVAMFVAISPWVVGFAGNTYWVTFTLFAPFVLSFCTYPYFKDKNKLWIFYGLVWASLFIKFLNGYEYASTLVFSVFVAIVFYEMREHTTKLFALWREALLVFLVGVLALISAISLNVIGLYGHAGDMKSAFSLVMSRADDRSSPDEYKGYAISSLKRTVPDVYAALDRVYNLEQLKDGNGHTLKYAFISALNYLMLPAVSIPVVMREPIGTMLQSVMFIGLMSYVCLLYLKRAYSDKTTVRQLTYAYWLSLLGAVSWLILMPGHSLVHAHINAIVFYVPYLLFCYIILGLSLQVKLHRVKH